MSAPQQSLRIVLVDDNADILESMAMVLNVLGHVTETCLTGELAVERIVEWKPDAAIVDASLPGISGYDVARAVGAAALTPDPVLVAMTGWDRDEDRQRSQEAGFGIHVVKPLDLQQLRTLLDEISDRVRQKAS